LPVCVNRKGYIESGWLLGASRLSVNQLASTIRFIASADELGRGMRCDAMPTHVFSGVFAYFNSQVEVTLVFPSTHCFCGSPGAICFSRSANKGPRKRAERNCHLSTIDSVEASSGCWLCWRGKRFSFMAPTLGLSD